MLPELRGPARPIVTLDTGVSYDHSASVALYRLPVGSLNPDHDRRPVFLAIPHVWPRGALLDTVVSDLLEFAQRVAPRFIAIETVGAGAMPSQEFRRRYFGASEHKTTWNMIATTQGKKLAAYSLLRWLFERGQLVLPRGPTLPRQLAGLRVAQQGQGARIDAEDPSVHDDVADALAFAMLPYLRAGSKVGCWMSRLADPQRALAEAPVPDLDEPVVETGGGLRVYRHPPLQSVSGSEVTLPAGVGVKQTASAHGRRVIRKAAPV